MLKISHLFLPLISSDRQLSSLEDQVKVLSNASGGERSLVHPLLPVEVPGVEKEEVIEGL